MKTALTQLIEKWESEMGSYIPNAPIYAAFIAEVKELLEAEKEQMMEAYKNGFKDAQRPFRPMESFTTWEQYYQQTYNQE